MKLTLLASALGLIVLAAGATIAAPRSPLSAFPSLTSAEPTPSAQPAPAAQPKPKAAPAAAAPARTVSAPAAGATKPAAVKPAPVATAAPAAPSVVASARTAPAAAVKPMPAPAASSNAALSQAPAAPVGARFASTPTPAPAVAAAPESLPIQSMAPVNTAQIKPYPLSAAEEDYLYEEASLKRRIRLLELQAKAAELERKIDGVAPAPAADSVNVAALPINPQQSVLDIPPPQPFRLVSVWGVGEDLNADLLTNGVRISVRKGDPLPEGWMVTGVGRNSIQVKRGRNTMVVKIGG